MFHIKIHLDEVNLRYCIVAKLFFFFILSEFYAMRHNILGNNGAFPVTNIKIKMALQGMIVCMCMLDNKLRCKRPS